MTLISPFRAVRPAADKAHLVASRSYLTYSRADLNRKLSENPYSFIHIINPEFGSSQRSKSNSDERFKNIQERYLEFLREGILMQDKAESLYVYRQEGPLGTFTGLIGGVSVEEYLAGKIKIHEHTLTEREEVFSRYLDICDFNAEPVLLTYKHASLAISDLFSAIIARRPANDFSTTDRTRHTLWVVSNPEDIQALQNAFETLPELYIADGHHRMASSSRLSAKRDKGGHPGRSLHKSVMAYIIPATELSILPFHRLVEMQGMNGKDMLAKLKNELTVSL